MLLWGSSCLVLGWASGNFGFFGINKNSVDNISLNYLGFVIALLSMGIFFFVKPSVKKVESADDLHDNLDLTTDLNVQLLSEPAKPKDETWINNLSPANKRILGCVLAIISGVFYGLNFVPPTYLINHPTSFGRVHSTESLDYVFSHFCGIFMASTVYFIIYCIVSKNKPQMPASIVLPAFISGAVWAVGQIMFFIANGELEFVVSFPIVSTGPGLVASLWGVLLFKEITDRRNFLILAIAFSVTLVGVTLIALSKIL